MKGFVPVPGPAGDDACAARGSTCESDASPTSEAREKYPPPVPSCGIASPVVPGVLRAAVEARGEASGDSGVSARPVDDAILCRPPFRMGVARGVEGERPEVEVMEEVRRARGLRGVGEKGVVETTK